MPAEELGTAVQAALGKLAKSRPRLVKAAHLLNEVATILATSLQGTRDPDAAQLPTETRKAATDIGTPHETISRVEQDLFAYLLELGVIPPPTTLPHPPAPPSELPPKLATRVGQAQRRVGQRPDGTKPAHGEWVRSDGLWEPVSSGTQDKQYQDAVRFARQNLPRPAERLTSHMEIKVAVMMRQQGLTDETIVIDRRVRGTRPFERGPYVCHNYLKRFLPPGARLRVIQGDGTIREYEGGSAR